MDININKNGHMNRKNHNTIQTNKNTQKQNITKNLKKNIFDCAEAKLLIIIFQFQAICTTTNK